MTSHCLKKSIQLVLAYAPALIGRQLRIRLGREDVFGSTARGETDARSDVDLLVDLEPGRSLLDLARLQRKLEALLAIPVDVVSSRGLRDRVRENVLRDALPL